MSYTVILMSFQTICSINYELIEPTDWVSTWWTWLRIIYMVMSNR